MMKTGRYVWRLKVGTAYKLTMIHYARVWTRGGAGKPGSLLLNNLYYVHVVL